MLRSPPPLRPGDVVRVVAPSGPFPRDAVLRGMAWLGTRYRLRASPGMFDRQGYLAGDDAARARAMSDAMSDPDARAIYCARGGYGAMRILSALPWAAFARSPKWLVGFSDITALHAGAAAAGLCSIHAPNVTGLSGPPPPTDRLALIRALEGSAPAPWTGLRIVRGGGATGPLVGGNLAVLAALLGSPFFRLPAGAVLALEDVTERPYRIDRMLTSLRLAGALDGLAAIVCGEFTACDPGADGVTVEDVLARCLGDLGIPVALGAPFGHGDINRAFVHGGEVDLVGDVVHFRVG